MVIIIEYGMGNVGSVANMLRKLGIENRIATEAAGLHGASHLILPGVGAFDHGMAHLARRGLIEPLKTAVQRGTPILGICLGMQLLGRSSEEGSKPGLGWLPAQSIRFKFSNPADAQRKVPHMGWNEVQIRNPEPLFCDWQGDARFYFVHSYHVVCDNPAHIVATAKYGIEFTAAVRYHNIYGVQFHPEKSHRFGMQILRNFVSKSFPRANE